MSVIEEAHRAVERSRAELYLNGWDDATRELTSAADALRTLAAALRAKPLPADRRHQLLTEVNAFRAELGLAERMHQQAGVWETNFALAVQETLGLRAAAYGPDGTPSSGGTIRRLAWEG